MAVGKLPDLNICHFISHLSFGGSPRFILGLEKKKKEKEKVNLDQNKRIKGFPFH